MAIPLDGNATWVRTEVGSPSITNVSGLEIHADTWDFGFVLWVDGVWFDPLPAAGAPSAEGVPSTLRLVAGPNPFTRELSILLSVPERQAVQLSVYDVSGRRVRQLVHGEIEGTQAVVWDGRDDLGRQIATGVYWLRFDAASGTLGRKILRLEN